MDMTPYYHGNCPAMGRASSVFAEVVDPLVHVVAKIRKDAVAQLK